MIVESAERFGLSLSESDEGWSLGDVTKVVDVARVRAVLSREGAGEIVGRGLMGWVVVEKRG